MTIYVIKGPVIKVKTLPEIENNSFTTAIALRQYQNSTH